MKRVLTIVALIAATVLMIVAPAAAASADGLTTTTTFASSASQTAVFGSNWVMPIVVAGTGQYPPPVDATSGTVNILIEGQPGTYATGLPIAPGGQAFFSPTTSKPPLGAGTYKVTAVFVPATASGLAPSQTTTPAVLTVTAIDLSASFTVQTITIHNQPGAQVVAQVSEPTGKHGIPSGSWDVKAVNAAGTIAFEKKVTTKADPTTPTTVTLSPGLKPGSSYAISATFSPESTIAGGYDVANDKPQQTTIAAESLGEILSTKVRTPPWALIAVGVGLLLLIATAIVLIVRRRREPIATPRAHGDAPRD